MKRQTALQRITWFYIENPDEELSIPDIEVKFGLKKQTAQDAVAKLISGGKFERVDVVRRREKGIAR